MIRSLRNSISAVLLTSLFIGGCATTYLTSSWKDPAYTGQPRKVLVIGVSRKPVIKRMFEDEYVRQLKERGIPAVAGYTVMPDAKQNDHSVIAVKLKEQGADVVLFTRLASKKTVLTNVPGSFSVQPSYYGNWRDYYAYGSQVMYTPGYTAEDEYALIETNLYNAVNDKLIWSANSETEILGTDQDQIKSYIGVMVDEMVHQKLLK